MAIKVYPVASTNVKYYTTDHISMNNNLIKEKKQLAITFLHTE